MPAEYPNKLVRVSRPSENVLLLEMNRPKVNALSNELWLEIGKCADVAHVDPDVRCVVLASALDKIFTAGLDLTDASVNMQSSDPGRWGLEMREHIKELQDAITSLERCDKPIIAACHGIAYGGAVDIMAACDIRFAATDSVFSIKEIDVGLAADIGSLQRLPWKTGNDSLLRELALSARDFGVQEADKLGLISRTVQGSRREVVAEALKLAQIIASKSPIAVLGTKHIMNHNTKKLVQDGLEYVRLWNMTMLQSEDLAKAFEAFATKKPPKYSKL